jgi:hypothetical protein
MWDPQCLNVMGLHGLLTEIALSSAVEVMKTGIRMQDCQQLLIDKTIMEQVIQCNADG